MGGKGKLMEAKEKGRRGRGQGTGGKKVAFFGPRCISKCYKTAKIKIKKYKLGL